MGLITDTPILVTGVTGFIGSNTTAHLLNEGYRVRGSLRSMEKADWIRDIIGEHAPTEGLEFVEADLLDAESWENAVDGVEYVHHIASPLPLQSPEDEDEVIKPARDGTLNVLRASAAADVKRVVLTSSVAACGFGLAGDPSRTYTEDDWTDPDGDVSVYVKSKALAERAAWDFVGEEAAHMELVTINPVYVLGPLLTTNASASVTWVTKALKGELPVIPRLSLGVVDVRDVAEAHLAGMVTPEAAGQRFILNAETCWYEELITALREQVPSHRKKLPKFRAPNILIRLFALIDSETRVVVDDLGVRREFDSARARDVLGWSPRSMAEAARATADTAISLGVV